MSPVPANSLAPDFTLPDHTGTNHSLSNYKGHWVLIYFYPKDDTPACTTQACEIRDNWAQFQQAGITVLGISKDTVRKHKKFVEKFQLPFTLLADTTTEVCQRLGIWAPKKFMGREYLGIHRTSFLIDPQGTIRKVYENVDAKTHAQTILDDYQSLQ